jgi:hypothetical protein
MDLSRRRGIAQLASVWQPPFNLADRRRRQIRQHLREVTLGIDAVTASGLVMLDRIGRSHDDMRYHWRT